MNVLSGPRVVERAREHPATDAPFYLADRRGMYALRNGLSGAAAAAAEGTDRLRQDAFRRPHGGAARFAAAHRLLSRRPDGGRPDRPLSSQGWRHRVDGRPVDPRRSRRRHLLSRRGGGSAKRRNRRSASAHRRPAHPAAGAHRRNPAGARRLHARRLLQPGLPEHPQIAEAQHPPAFSRHRLRLPAAGGGGEDRRRRKRPARVCLPGVWCIWRDGCAIWRVRTWKRASRRGCWSTARSSFAPECRACRPFAPP